MNILNPSETYLGLTRCGDMKIDGRLIAAVQTAICFYGPPKAYDLIHEAVEAAKKAVETDTAPDDPEIYPAERMALTITAEIKKRIRADCKLLEILDETFLIVHRET